MKQTNPNLLHSSKVKLLLNAQQQMTRIPIWKIPNDTCSVGRSIKMCLSSLPGLIRALSKISALLVEARTMTWSVVPMPAKEEEVSILPEK